MQRKKKGGYIGDNNKESSEKIQTQEEQVLLEEEENQAITQQSVDNVEVKIESKDQNVIKENVKVTENEIDKLEKQIKVKEKEYEDHKNSVSDMISEHATKMTILIQEVEENEDKISFNEKEISKLDHEIMKQERVLQELKQKQKNLKDDDKTIGEKIEKIKKKRERFEMYVGKEMSKAKNNEVKISEEIQILREKIKNAKTKEVSNMQRNELSEEPKKLVDETSSKYREFLLKSMKKKESQLECPVCLETAVSPIFSCSKQHLICSSCRPKLKQCPECRIPYEVETFLYEILSFFSFLLHSGTSGKTQIC